MIYFLFAPVLFCIYMLIRNQRVYNFQTYLLRRVSDQAKQDIINGKEWEWRFEDLEKSSYDEKMYKFWKRLTVENFYKNDDFINPTHS